MAAIEIHGHCFCGSVNYTVNSEPMWCSHCHCGDCRRFVGGAVATFVGFEKKHFFLSRGEFASIESSPGVNRSFCRQCGTPMAYESEKIPGEIHLHLGTLDHPEAYPPQLEVYCRERLPWLKLAVDGPSFQDLPE